MTKQEIENWAARHRFVKDNNYGHMYKDGRTKEGDTIKRHWRIKLQKLSWRYERKIEHPATQYSPKSYSWTRIAGGYYKETWLTDDDKLSTKKREDAGSKATQDTNKYPPNLF